MDNTNYDTSKCLFSLFKLSVVVVVVFGSVMLVKPYADALTVLWMK